MTVTCRKVRTEPGLSASFSFTLCLPIYSLSKVGKPLRALFQFHLIFIFIISAYAQWRNYKFHLNFYLQLQFKCFRHYSHNLHSHNFVCASFVTILYLSRKCAKSLTYKEKIVKKGLRCSFFLSIVHISGKKWGFVENCDLRG